MPTVCGDTIRRGVNRVTNIRSCSVRQSAPWPHGIRWVRCHHPWTRALRPAMLPMAPRVPGSRATAMGEIPGWKPSRGEGSPAMLSPRGWSPSMSLRPQTLSPRSGRLCLCTRVWGFGRSCSRFPDAPFAPQPPRPPALFGTRPPCSSASSGQGWSLRPWATCRTDTRLSISSRCKHSSLSSQRPEKSSRTRILDRHSVQVSSL